jgi:hypothetical protein
MSYYGNLVMSRTSDIPYHVLEATYQQYLRQASLQARLAKQTGMNRLNVHRRRRLEWPRAGHTQFVLSEFQEFVVSLRFAIWNERFSPQRKAKLSVQRVVPAPTGGCSSSPEIHHQMYP